jgi:predicted MPP superfamily phosphohydrolase
MSQTEQRQQTRRSSRPARLLAVVCTAIVLLFGVPWWALVLSGPRWPVAVVAAGTVLFAGGAIALPVLMYHGHGRHGRDRAARIGDTLLGVVWVLFAWTVLGTVPRVLLALFGVPDPLRARVVALLVVAVSLVLVVWGWTEAMRVPRVRTVQVTLDRLGPGLDGTRVVVLADTHYGPIDRSRWSAKTARAVNELDPDIVCHAGDIADGRVAARLTQAAPLGSIRARLARGYVTGNHEYFGAAQEWLDHMAELGWQPLHNRHVVVSRGGDRLVLAGIDDATAQSSGLAGHGADITEALAGADPELPVLLVAHQPRQVTQAVAAGVDLQVSGHTHGGQIWPFHYLVRVDQPTVHGLRRFGARTQLYTTRGAGFWGPPLRIFAPSEITLLVLRSAR